MGELPADEDERHRQDVKPAHDQPAVHGRRAGTLRAVPKTDPAITPERSRTVLAGTFPGDLGIELVAIDDEEVRGRLAVDRRHLHPGGYVHGGVWVAFADTVAAWGTMRHLPAGHDFTTAELKCNVFAAARAGDELTATGVPLHVGRRTQAWEVRVHRGERLGALFVCTQVVLG
jgi:1,4-dihydroxy-2-naphthoyl-CoA hydrolase